MGDLIAGVLRETGVGRSDKLSKLEAAWRELVGRRWAEDTTLVSYRGGVLTVQAKSSSLAHELEVYRKAQLLKELQARTGLLIDDLRCRVGGRGGAPQDP